MREGESVVTTTGGITYTGQFLGMEDCPNNWAPGDTWECARIKLTSDAGSVPFTGDYWTVRNYGVSWMVPADGVGKWNLSNAWFAF